jgi:effector-binding domain-containing protein
MVGPKTTEEWADGRFAEHLRSMERQSEKTKTAVAVHRGPFSELDRTYTALGGFVAEQGLGSLTRTATRENYLVSLFKR